MKRLLVALAALLLVVGTAPSVWALGVSADLPVQYTFTEQSDPDLETDGVNGFKVGLHELLFIVGAGYENYTVDFTADTTGDPEGTLNNTFIDLIVDLPVPLINLGAGYGMGTGRVEFDDSGSPEFDDASLSQFFLTFGAPIGLFDVHVGYHEISGTAEAKDSGTDDIELGSNMLSVGAKLGF